MSNNQIKEVTKRSVSVFLKKSLAVNLLPVTIRNIDSESVEVFKSELSLVPDQLTTPGHPKAA